MKNQKSITGIMTIILSVTILVQIAILLSIVYLGRVPQKIREESYLNFDKNINESVSSVYKTIDSKLNFDEFVFTLWSDIARFFPSIDYLPSSSREKQLEALAVAPTYLISLLNNTKANGAFIHFENDNEVVDNIVVNEGVYISFFPNTFNYNQKYIAEVMSKDLDVDIYNLLVDYDVEEFEIDIADKNNRYYNIIKGNSVLGFHGLSPFISVRYQEFFDADVINISYPILNTSSETVAIVGLEFLLSEFLIANPTNEDITYVLGYTDSNDFIINPVLTWGKDDETLNKQFNISNLPTLDKYYSIIGDKEKSLSIHRLEFYRENRNLYTNENWVFVGIVDQNVLTGSSKYVESIILTIMFISVLFGFIIIYLTNLEIAKPIRLLSDEVRDRSANMYNEFTKSNVEEVNNLILNFEKLSYDVLQYSNKITNAVNTFLLGIYFYQNKDDGVYCTQAFLDMCGSDLKEGNLSREEFDKIYQGIINSYYDKRHEAFQLANNHWIKLETKTESSFTLGIVTDITDQIREVKKIEKELEVDGFTKLYNRIAFQKLATQVFEKHSDKIIAVIMWDMDKLKYINDRYGHETGDRYIMLFADIIRTLENHDAIVARRSGDEFFAIVYSEHKDYIIKALENVRSMINQAVLYVSDDITEKVRASVGIAWYPENGNDLLQLLDYADKKLYQSKYEFEGMSSILSRGFESNVNLHHFNKELAKVIDGDYVTFAYQPIVNAKNGEIFGYEMLMRIFSDILNNPKKLLDIAQENEKLDVVEEITFKKGFESYQLNIDNIKNRKIFINSISNIKLANRAMQELLELAHNNLDMLVVELTRLKKADKELVANKIQMFKNHKAKIAIDNFKLDYINSENSNLDVDFIKVDISIINNIESSVEQQKALEDIVRFAKANNYKVVAVGIKNYKEMAVVIDCGVDYLQGYYLAEPTVKPSNIKQNIISEIKKLQKK